MTHDEIEQKETIERYVQHQLATDERLAFQEHFFGCDECFEQVQTTARFIAGVREESTSGVFAADRIQTADARASSWFGWLKPVLVLSVATSVLLAAALAWLWFGQLPSLRQEVAREKQARQDSERNIEAARNQADEAQRQLDIERVERAKLADQLQARSKAGERPGSDLIAQANIPVVTLESTRDSQEADNQLTVPLASKSALLWIPVEPGKRFASFRVQILTHNGLLVETVTIAKANRYGALTVSVPASHFQSGKYLVKLYGLQNGQPELLGEYDLLVRKQ